MKRLSLKTRSIMLALVALAVFIPVTVYVLDKAYTSSLTQAKLNELKLMNLALVSAFEVENDRPVMPDFLYEEQLNLPDSGYVGFVIFRNKIVWQSASALHVNVTKPASLPAVGDEQFTAHYEQSNDDANAYFAYGFTAEFATNNDFVPVQFFILNNREEFAAERSTFLNTVWQGLSLLGLLLVLVMVTGITVVLAPVRKLITEIKHTSEGHQQQLDGAYPKEFSGLKKSINHLLETEAQQRKRYKNSLGDLAHSLKTPLAVALGANHLPDDARDSLLQIDRLIQRQLKRATAGQKGWQAPVVVAPVMSKLKRAMDKVYEHRNLTLTIEVTGEPLFYGDDTDLFEMLGNLTDNACKAARRQVLLKTYREGPWMYLIVEDDGPGIAASVRARLLERGNRLDTYTEGQGIGMAVVADLVDIYEGQLTIYDSAAGGAGIQLRLPAGYP